MLTMIIKMSGITLLYVVLTFLLWKSFNKKSVRRSGGDISGADTGQEELLTADGMGISGGVKLSIGSKILVGVIFGIMSVLSTHFGVDYGDMVLNVRDLGPMEAGLFFDPLSGVIAGLIGGIERYIAGTYFGVGEYTRIACSISTCFAGFFAWFLNKVIFKGRKPSIAYAFFMGAVIEVFHMYVVFLTHRGDMTMALNVVKTCSVPMMIFSGLGLALTSVIIMKSCGELINPTEYMPKEKRMISGRFQVWLFCVSASVLLINFGFNFSMQSNAAIQDAQADLKIASLDISNAYVKIRDSGGSGKNFSHHVGMSGTFFIVTEEGEYLTGTNGPSYYNSEIEGIIKSHKNDVFFQAQVYGDESLCLIHSPDGSIRLFTELPMTEVYQARDAEAYEIMLADILLFTVIYVLISLLVQNMVVDNLLKVNESLNRITEGDLEEKVSVYESVEFASLSEDINQTVDALKGYIDAAEKRMEQDLLLAKTIQASALPKEFDFRHEGFEIYATMDPAKQVGGDFYDFFFVEQDRLAMVIADVSGKGVPAALFMMHAKTAIRGLAETGGDLVEIFEKVNNELCIGNEAEMFVTVWMCIINLRNGNVRCVNAGHEYPALMRFGGDYELIKDRHGLPLAAMEGAKYKEYELHLDPGDCIYVYTDGVPEAINVDEEQYGTDRMLQMLSAIKDASMRDILPAVKRDIDEFAGKADQFDDITMLGFRYEGPMEEL